MIAKGLKTLEVRSWFSAHRGDLVICSSKSPDTRAMFEFKIEPDGFEEKYPLGKARCIVEVVNWRRMVPADNKAACCRYLDGYFVAELANVRSVRPFSVRGQLNIFDVPFEI